MILDLIALPIQILFSLLKAYSSGAVVDRSKFPLKHSTYHLGYL